MDYYIPYEEPDAVTILVLVSFLLLLNVVNHYVNKFLYCGLVSQILLGIAWGTPGGKFLSESTEDAIMKLSYIGLLLMVYEGGLGTSIRIIKEHIILSFMIAATGVIVPMGLSFVLIKLSGASAVASFAAGASLCSTSLGSAFAILSASGLLNTRVGVSLVSCAMLDDIVGLIMVQIVSNLGEGSFTAVTVIRPVFVSIGMIVVLILVCWLIVLPLTIKLNKYREKDIDSTFNKIVGRREITFAIHTLLLIGFTTGATYAGASNLTAAFICGAAISWWDEEVPHFKPKYKKCETSISNIIEEHSENINETTIARIVGEIAALERSMSNLEIPVSRVGFHFDGIYIFEKYYWEIMHKILRPFFFASIGFSIPIKLMFTGRLIWRGIVYSLIMFASKCFCGLWLLNFSLIFKVSQTKKRDDKELSSLRTELDLEQKSNVEDTGTNESNYHILPSLLLGLCMVPRGEIGFLISSLAESKGVFSNNHPVPLGSDQYVVVTWAVVFCTFIAPIIIGFLIKRIKNLEKTTHNPLGKWGYF